MPSIFHLENTNSDTDRIRNYIAIEGISRYLMKNSEKISLKSPPSGGDPEIGKKLVNEKGCLGCHSVESAKANNHGPELVNLGSKVGKDWLFTWLKDPKHYSKDTRMPNLRLSDEEAAHITSYLLESRNPEFEAKPIPKFHEEELDTFVSDYLSRNMRMSEAREQLSKMDLDQKFQFVGKEIIAQQGCFGCHDIRGFEKSKPIGTELTKEGQKEIDKLDFGFSKIERTRGAWFTQKLKHPRSFDEGKIKAYHEKLRMPEFGFSDEQTKALVTFLLSLREENIPLQMQKKLNLKEEVVERGRFLVAKYNCQGCHTLDGTEGRIRALYDDKGKAPPILDGEGAKVQEKWLYHFLENPSSIRPWLSIHMPTFGFSEDQIDTLIGYFSNLAAQKTSFAPDSVSSATPENIEAGRGLFIKFKCIQCHQSGAAGLSASFLAPDLVIAHERLKSNWVIEWLKDPQVLQSGTMMPTFFADGQTPVKDVLDGDTAKQIRAIRDYLWTLTPEEVNQIKSANKT